MGRSAALVTALAVSLGAPPALAGQADDTGASGPWNSWLIRAAASLSPPAATPPWAGALIVRACKPSYRDHWNPERRWDVLAGLLVGAVGIWLGEHVAFPGAPRVGGNER